MSCVPYVSKVRLALGVKRYGQVVLLRFHGFICICLETVPPDCNLSSCSLHASLFCCYWKITSNLLHLIRFLLSVISIFFVFFLLFGLHLLFIECPTILSKNDPADDDLTLIWHHGDGVNEMHDLLFIADDQLLQLNQRDLARYRDGESTRTRTQM